MGAFALSHTATHSWQGKLLPAAGHTHCSYSVQKIRGRAREVCREVQRNQSLPGRCKLSVFTRWAAGTTQALVRVEVRQWQTVNGQVASSPSHWGGQDRGEEPWEQGGTTSSPSIEATHPAGTIEHPLTSGCIGIGVVRNLPTTVLVAVAACWTAGS
jgi:hypothetical protein